MKAKTHKSERDGEHSVSLPFESFCTRKQGKQAKCLLYEVCCTFRRLTHCLNSVPPFLYYPHHLDKQLRPDSLKKLYKNKRVLNVYYI